MRQALGTLALLPLSLSSGEIQTALAAGEFKVLAWATAVALALLHLND